MTGIIFAGAALARRLEAAEVAAARGTCSPGAETLEIGGGCAIFAGAESPLTEAVGMGLDGPAAAEQIDAAEAFFSGHGAIPRFQVCPLASPEFVAALGVRGYRITEFNNVLARTVGAEDQLLAAPHVRRAEPQERELWCRSAGRGFFERDEISEEEMDIGRAICSMPGAVCYFAETAAGAPAGSAACAIERGVAMLFADSTIAAFRGAGLHCELIAARLRDAATAGCDVATASTLPGSGSQRNYERMGFRVVYTRVALTRPGK